MDYKWKKFLIIIFILLVLIISVTLYIFIDKDVVTTGIEKWEISEFEIIDDIKKENIKNIWQIEIKPLNNKGNLNDLR